MAKLGAKLDVIASQLAMQEKTMSVTKEMAQVSNQLSVALKDMNVEKIAAIMDTFESQNQQLSLNSDLMNQVMDQQQDGIAAPMQV